MTILHPCRVSSKEFSYKNNKFCAFASDLGPEFQPDRVYDDACDEGFTIVSEKTGREVVFALNHVENDDEEIKFWDYISVTPKHKGIIARIFND